VGAHAVGLYRSVLEGLAVDRLAAVAISSSASRGSGIELLTSPRSASCSGCRSPLRNAPKSKSVTCPPDGAFVCARRRPPGSRGRGPGTKCRHWDCGRAASSSKPRQCPRHSPGQWSIQPRPKRRLCGTPEPWDRLAPLVDLSEYSGCPSLYLLLLPARSD
jgi:hypothetical protein